MLLYSAYQLLFKGRGRRLPDDTCMASDIILAEWLQKKERRCWSFLAEQEVGGAREPPYFTLCQYDQIALHM